MSDQPKRTSTPHVPDVLKLSDKGLARAKIDDAAPRLRLADFIRQEMDAVIVEWVAFAKTHVLAGASMTQLALQDHIAGNGEVADGFAAADRDRDCRRRGSGRL